MWCRLLKAACVLAISILLSSCSFKSIYNRMDLFLVEYIEGMVTLDNVLLTRLETQVDQLLLWHRKTQLEAYAEWLSQVQQEVLNGLTVLQVEKRIGEIDHFWQTVAIQVNQRLALMLVELNPAQVKELYSSLRRKNEEFEEKYIHLTPEEQFELNYERLYEQYESWLGDINSLQDEQIKKTAAQLLSTAKLRLQRRQEWQRGIYKILYARENAGAGSRHLKLEQLNQFLSSYQSLNSPQMQSLVQFNREQIVNLTVIISQSLDSDQTRVFTDKTSEYIEIFNELAGGK